MNYKRFNNKIVLRLDADEEICESIMAVAKLEDIRLGTVTGIGGANKLSLGIFDTEKKRYTVYDLKGTHEITSLMGNITHVNDKPYVHLHLTAVDEKARVAAGHLLSGHVVLTAEIFIDVIDGEVGRIRNETLGINEMNV